MEKHRIKLLDSFRFIAIVCVVLYHFTYSWVRVLPYGNFFHHIFSFGYLGVNFFFMISGFVISYTLELTSNLASFYRNRFARLFPAMLLCSVVTFLAVNLLDDHNLFKNTHEARNFLPGLTFINPSLWTLLTKTDFHWLNGSYWSLWVEIQFYIIASGVYFLNREHFFRNLLLAGIGISLIKYIPINLINNHAPLLARHNWMAFFENWRYGDEVFNITFYITWFLPGVVFYRLYKGMGLKQSPFILVLSAIMLYCLFRDLRTFFGDAYPIMMSGCLVMFTLFLIMIYRKSYLSFLDNTLFEKVGIISYTIYLIHENIGVLLISRYGHYLGSWSMLSPFIVLIILIGFAGLSWRFYEQRANRLLKKQRNAPKPLYKFQ